MTRRPALAVLPLLVLLLAGCGENPSHVVTLPTGEEVKVEEKIEESKGFVHGLVGDDAIQLLDDVFIRLVGTTYETRTAADGTFLLVNVEPGIYVLEGSKKDYATVQTTVDVHPGAVAKAVLLMERLPTTTPYCYTESHQAHVDASAAGSVVLGNSTRLIVDLDRNPSAVVVESYWEGFFSGATANPLYYRLTVLRNGEWYVEGSAPNPFTLPLEGRSIPPGEPQITIEVSPSTSETAAAADGTTYATVFQNIEAPSGWSILGGSDCDAFNAQHEDD